MNENEINQLAELLVRWHNEVNEKYHSFYGVKMEQALYRDTFSTLFVRGDYKRLCEIREGFKT